MYTSGVEGRPGWIPVPWTDTYNATTPPVTLTRLQRSFLYTPPTDGEASYTGQITTYPAGGYVADLTEYPYKAAHLIHALEANQDGVM